ESCHPKVVKNRYGAWYLDPKTWKKQNVGKSLMDLKETGNGVHNFIPPIQKEAEVSLFYRMWAFQEFLERKGSQKPGLDQLPNLTHFNGHMKAKACTKQAVRTGEPRGQITLFCNSVDLRWTKVQSYQE
ncbi:PREDICTED: protein FAM47E-like, partial [Cariama cristata]|uniref:protein FAM47E-like n=1 Tax=Cariama cristata TaxID=54380 RepID=UPI000520A23B